MDPTTLKVIGGHGATGQCHTHLGNVRNVNKLIDLRPFAQEAAGAADYSQLTVRYSQDSVNGVDFSDPLSAVMPGAKGRVFKALAAVDGEITLGRLGQVAGVSINQVSRVVNELAELGMVERREVPPSALVRLQRDNAATEQLLAFVDLHSAVLKAMSKLAHKLRPAPAAMVVYGSMAKGKAKATSDIDIAVVAKAAVFDTADWLDSISAFTEQVELLTGNIVSIVQISLEDVRAKRVAKSFWNELVADQVVLTGSRLEEL